MARRPVYLPAMWLNSALPRLSGWIVHSMHRVTAIDGAVPPAGPVLLVANHPSGLIDSVKQEPIESAVRYIQNGRS